MARVTDAPKYQYHCSEGHLIHSSQEHDHCLAIVRGSPCKGTLKRVGRGSRVQRR